MKHLYSAINQLKRILIKYSFIIKQTKTMTKNKSKFALFIQ